MFFVGNLQLAKEGCVSVLKADSEHEHETGALLICRKNKRERLRNILTTLLLLFGSNVNEAEQSESMEERGEVSEDAVKESSSVEEAEEVILNLNLK